MVQLLKVTKIELYESLIGLKKLIRSTVIYNVEIVFKKITCTYMSLNYGLISKDSC